MTDNNLDAVPVAETIDDFRRVEALSKSSFYKLDKAGLGPRVLRVPGTKIVRVVEGHAEWRERMAKLAASEAGELETARRRQLASVAGKHAAESVNHVSRRPPKRKRG